MRYETRSSIKWRYSEEDFIKLALKQLADVRRTDPAERFVFELSDRIFTLGRLDRYERRARSRRNTATRAFDAARLAGASQSSRVCGKGGNFLCVKPQASCPRRS
jgi:hypothetical protein